MDYDLGLVDERGVDWNGEDVLRWIELQVAEQGHALALPVTNIHSANPMLARSERVLTTFGDGSLIGAIPGSE